MSHNKSPVLCRPLIAPILYDSLRVEAFDKHVQLNDIIIKYIKLGIEKGTLTNFKKYEYNSEYPNYKDVYLPVESYEFIVEKSKSFNIGTSVLFMNYLVLGIKEEKGGLSKELNQWFDNLKIIG